MDPGILVQAPEDLGVHPGDAVGRLSQPLAVGILADGDQDLADRAADPLEIHVHRALGAGRRLVIVRDRPPPLRDAFSTGYVSAMIRLSVHRRDRGEGPAGRAGEIVNLKCYVTLLFR